MTKYNDNGSRASESTKKFLNDSGLSHVFSLITSFVRNYASPKTHNHDGVYAKSSHTHATSQVTGLDSALAGKAPASHTHTIAQVTNLQSSLDSKTPNSRKVNGKPLSTDITLTSADVKADAAGSATNALNSAKQYTDTVAAGKAAKSHIHDATNITTGTLSQDRLPLVPVSKGGTGKTNGKDAANYLINALEEGTSTPTDADKILTQYVGGGTTNTTYLRRPLSTLWSYIKPKCDAIYQAKGSYAAASHTHAISNITNLQAQLDGKQAKGSYAAASHTHTIANITNLQSTLDSKQPKGDYASASHSHAWGSITGKPSTFAPSSHSHTSLAYGSDVGDTTDWNTIPAGVHSVVQSTPFNASKHAPVGAYTYGTVMVESNGSNINQIYVAHQTGQMWFRNRFSSSNEFTSWAKVSTSSMSLLSSYPVGAVYISYSSTSPASLFGGSWVALTGVFPYFNAGTSLGGSNQVSHWHNQGSLVANIGATNSNTRYLGYEALPPKRGSYNMRIAGGNSGHGPGNFPANHSTGVVGDVSHVTLSNMPSYQTFYAWRRTS